MMQIGCKSLRITQKFLLKSNFSIKRSLYVLTWSSAIPQLLGGASIIAVYQAFIGAVTDGHNYG